MTESSASSSSGSSWRRETDTAERAVRGESDSRGQLEQILLDVPWEERVPGTPEEVGHFGYLLALLRELGLTEARARCLARARQWIERAESGPEGLWAVHNRLGVLFTEAGDHGAAEEALRSALRTARIGYEEASTCANLAVVMADSGNWNSAVHWAELARQTPGAARGSGRWLDIRMRAESVLFLAARESGDSRAAAGHARALQHICRQQIDRWGNDHPRALEALATMASAQHTIAVGNHDLKAMDRLVDVLAVTAQRSAAVLGARHPQAQAVRTALDRADEGTRQARAQQARAEPVPRPEPEQRLDRRRVAPSMDRVPVLELLVHGIDGATPEEMLGDPRVVQISGDSTAALFRKIDDTFAEQHREDRPGRPIPEAYSWSQLTAGNRSRVLWLLLFPFMAVNLAHWMHPSAPDHPRSLRLHGVLVRVAALSLTVLVVAAACELSMDLVAWQCSGTRACVERQHFWLGFMAPESDGWWSQPGRRLAVGALLPCAFIALLWRLSHRSWNAYESQRPISHSPDPEGDELSDPHRPALASPGFWYGRRLVARLNAAHTAAGCLVVAAALTLAPARFDRTAGYSAVLVAAGWALEGAIITVALVTVWVLCRRGHSRHRIDQRLDMPLTRAVLGSAVALLLLALVYAMWSRPSWHSVGRLPGDLIFSVGQLAQTLIVVALAVIGRTLFRRKPDVRTALSGLAPAAVVLLACFLYSVMAAGAVQGLSDWLNDYGGADIIAGPPPLVTWQMSTIPALVAVLLAQVGIAHVQLRRRGRRLSAVVGLDYPDEPPDPLRAGDIASARARASLTDSAPWLVGTMAAAVLLLSSLAMAGAWVSDDAPGGFATGASGLAGVFIGSSQGLSSWLIAVGFLLFLNSGRRAYHDPSSRGAIGILWDLGTFWPRAAHPFARLCYSERAIPDLTWRMTTWTSLTGGRLMVSGHSQGSVLAVAAIWQLAPSVRKRVQLLTYGSPLERIYGRWFPAYFGPGALHALHREVDAWRNLWRFTDPIGGPVRVTPVRITEHSGPDVDRPPLKDPLALGRTERHPLPAPINAHAAYQADPAYAEERESLLARMSPPTGPLPSSGRPLPHQLTEPRSEP
ncbi:hypothetical protein [Streptomyces phaeochromogenes]